MSALISVAAASRAAEFLVRAALPLAGVVLAALVIDGFGVTGARAVARLAVRAVLLSYVTAGLLNLPRFPRALRGPPTRAYADRWLLDFWTPVSLLVLGATILGGPVIPPL